MFNEQKEEYSAKKGENIPVYQCEKYKSARKKAIELIDKQ